MSGADRPKAFHNGEGQNFDAFWLETKRFESTGYQEDEGLWRFRVKVKGNVVADADATLTRLREMRSYLDRVIKMVETDGGRKDKGND